MISCINLLGILGDEAADFKGLAGKRSRMWEGTLATERGVWDRPNALPRKKIILFHLKYPILVYFN